MLSTMPTNKEQSFDLVIRCGHLLTMTSGAGESPITDQFIGVRDSKIVSIENWKSSGWATKEFIDASNKIVMPGLVNGHCHLPMTLFRGLADDLPFEQWLKSYIFPLEARLVSPEFSKLGAELAILEALSTGTTTIVDMYYFENSIAETCERGGMRAILGQTFIDFAAPDNKELNGNDWKLLDALREQFSGHSRITPALAPHAPYTVGDETFKKVHQYAAKYKLPITVHVSETKHEVETSLKQYGKTPLKRLNDLGVLDTHTIMAHCVHLTDEEMKLASQKWASVVHNPESNMKLGSGAAPIQKLINAGICVGLGTDGPASNNDLNMFNEMDSAAKLQKLVHEDNTAMTATMALRMATREGAKALGLGAQVGTLEIGKLADIIVIDPCVPNMQPMHNILSQLVYASSGREVETVIIHGEIVFRDRRATRIDANSVFDRVNHYRSKNKF